MGPLRGRAGFGHRATGDKGPMSSWPSIAIVGAGMGGLATAAALHRRGIGVTVYEQARVSPGWAPGSRSAAT